jgi:hypothetical protein
MVHSQKGQLVDCYHTLVWFSKLCLAIEEVEALTIACIASNNENLKANK